MRGRHLGELGRSDELVLGPTDGAQNRRWAVLTVGRQVLFAQDLLHQGLLVVGVVDDEARVQSDRRSIAAQDPSADRVKRPHRDFAAGLPHERQDPRPHLRGRLIGERHREDSAGTNALDSYKVGDAVGEDAGLAAACPGQDEQGTLGGRDGPGLLGVQPRQNPIGECLGGAAPLGLLGSPSSGRKLVLLRRWGGDRPGLSGRIGRPEGCPSGDVAGGMRRLVVGPGRDETHRLIVGSSAHRPRGRGRGGSGRYDEART